MGPISILTSIYSETNPLEFRDAVFSITAGQTLKPSQIVIVINGPISSTLMDEINKLKKNLTIDFATIQLPINRGLANALNEGINKCRYEFVARMDMDDIALPKRLELQYKYMLKHPSVQVLGGQITGWSNDMKHCLFKKRLPLTYQELKTWSKSRCPLNHPTVMFRKSTIIQYGCYPDSPLQDYQLWIKLIRAGKVIENLRFVLVKMRVENAIRYRRGFSVLLSEIDFFKELLSVGYISKFEYLKNIFSRLILRSLPGPIRLFFYRTLS